ncbi:hypothetical protein MGG_00512 [Pyricularia oryzae 70-15]|uniref:Uncharacterized protein n=3 Tax=Pyricularia oryzae TaxID=318829 RepID=G4NBQ3_PYRO7|nr:uncharacterized protein MGG_00512 [Pyricularia oryzae 70-15]EHA48961.1 hypothetical protein MGG_00512 [Pyricularia oryzae 70-15]ELQ38853.1 hypothetical protein OOU_Y34scaffold00522g8 [Pyricularia oryzae Y34]
MARCCKCRFRHFWKPRPHSPTYVKERPALIDDAKCKESAARSSSTGLPGSPSIAAATYLGTLCTREKRISPNSIDGFLFAPDPNEWDLAPCQPIKVLCGVERSAVVPAWRLPHSLDPSKS